MSEAKKCPKCGGEMVQEEFLKNLPKVIVSVKKVEDSIESFPISARSADSWKSTRK